ncbi:MAG: PKD domain-containing protein, partial [bacterium]|nr:PKD domain-containing protein [bacterium]
SATNPAHLYTSPGTYTVSLTVSGPGGSDVRTRTNYITVSHPAPTADFVGTPLSGVAPLTVQFTDQSTGTITSRLWTFGDGGSSPSTHPSHQYTTPGTYTVVLLVSGPGGADTRTRTSYITVLDAPPVANFSGSPLTGTEPLTVSFTDQSTGNVTSRLWDFGDGQTSAATNPNHPYPLADTYTVSLTVTGPGGSDSRVRWGYVTVSAVAPIAAFSAVSPVGAAPLPVTFLNQSSRTIDTYAWDLGDGTTSTEEEPVHEYATPGTYTVALTVNGPGGSDTRTRLNYVRIVDPAGPFHAHFQKQTPAANPPRYTLPAVEADNDGFGVGDPSTGPLPCASSDRTNPDVVRIVLTDEEDETPLRSTAPGREIAVGFDYTVELVILSTTTTYGCDYELYSWPEDTGEPQRIEPISNRFQLVIPGTASTTSKRRSLEIRFFTDPDMTVEALRSVIVKIESVAVNGSPPAPPPLLVGANDRVTWLLEDNANAPPGSPGDDCSAALPIAGVGKFPFDTTGRSPSNEATCGSGDDIWFRWTAPATGDFFFDSFDAQFNSVVELYAGLCGSLSSLDCDNGSLASTPTAGSGVSRSVTFGDVYNIRVGVAQAGSGGPGNLTIQELRPGLGPYVQLGHTTPATRRAEGQVSTKVARDFTTGYFGIRFKDVDRNTNGYVDGVLLELPEGITIEATVDAHPNAAFTFYSAPPPSSPVTWTGPTTFTIEIPSGSPGIALWSEFGDSTAGGFKHDVAFELTGAELTQAGTLLPKVGWNRFGKWMVIN